MQTRALSLLTIIAVIATGCGGGGGGGSSAAPTPPPAPYGLSSAPPAAALNFPLSGGSASIQVSATASGLAQPVAFGAIPGNAGRNFAVEQRGSVRVLDANLAVLGTLLDISAQVTFIANGSDERGLLGLAFDPAFASNGHFYVNYISAKTGGRCAAAVDSQCTRISRFTANLDSNNIPLLTTASNATEKVLLEISQPFDNHNGGMLAFGPDGYLYIALGDGGSGGDPAGNAQNLGTLLGKILRIDPHGADPYAVPANNPFVNVGGARPEIWAYGLRNPWRFSFDRQTGKLWAADVGQALYEEIDIIVAGGNYGWNAREGLHPYNGGALPPGAVDPVWEYGRSSGQSVTGGYVYRGNAIPALRGKYVYADFISGTIWGLDSVNFANATLLDTAQLISGFGEDADGELYFLDYFDGDVYRILPGGSSGGSMPTALSATGLFTGLAPLQAAPGLIEYDVNTPLWSDGTVKRRWLALPAGGKIAFSASGAWQFPVGTVLVKNFAIAADARNPAQLRNLETRVLIHENSGWAGYTYRWNSNQTDAALITAGASEMLTLTDAGGSVSTRQYDYPSSAQCSSCHTTAAGFVLGLRTRQMNRTFDYDGIVDNQLRSFNHVALFTTDIGSAGQYAASASLDNTAVGIAQRARDYLDANCAQCHQPGGGSGVNIDLRASTAAAAMNAIDIAPGAGSLGIGDARIIASGSKERSVLWERMRSPDPAAGRMPPLASHAVDEQAVALIGQWIDSL